MGKTISVVVCPQDIRQAPYIKEIDDDLKSLQKLVGGYVEQVTLYGIEDGHYIILCDEDGRLKNKPLNCLISGYVLVGDIIIARQKDFELQSVSKDFLERFVKLYWTDLRRM